MSKGEYVVETEGSGPFWMGERGSGKPLAIVLAESAEEAVSKYISKHSDMDSKNVWATSLIEWAYIGDYIERGGENEPICSLCITEDGGFMGEEEELSADEYRPCWHCIQLCRNAVEDIY